MKKERINYLKIDAKQGLKSLKSHSVSKHRHNRRDMSTFFCLIKFMFMECPICRVIAFRVRSKSIENYLECDSRRPSEIVLEMQFLRDEVRIDSACYVVTVGNDFQNIL